MFFFQFCRKTISARKRKKSESQNLIFSRRIAIPQISVVVRHSRNAKSQIISLENLRGIVRQAKVGKSANSVVTDSSCYVAKRTVRQRFFNRKVCLFSFFTMPHNDRGYVHWRFAGAFAVVKRQSECGRKDRKMHVSQPVNIGVC